MKNLFQLLLGLLFLSWSLSTVVLAQQASTGHTEKTSFMNPDQECTGTGELIYDDGTFENGYGWNAAVVTQGIITMLFTPDEYPWQFTTMCVALTQNQTNNLTFDIVMYDDDGAGGAPGTVLGEVTGLSATGIPGWPALGWYEFDMSSTAALVDGSCYIGIRWNSVATYPGTYIGADESTTTTMQPGYNWNDNAGTWSTNVSLWAGYRAMGIRTLGEPAIPCPVDPATDPNPADMATDVSVGIGSLSWTNGANTTANEVWFGEVGNMSMVYDGAPITTWSLGTLDYNTDYQWRIRCKNDSCGKNSTWTFTTEQDPNLLTLMMDDFESGLGNWTVNTTGGCPWAIFTDPAITGRYTLPPTAGGGILAADADNCGSSGGGSSGSVTFNNPIDATQYSSVAIEWDNDWQAISTSDFAYVDVSTDGGTTWQNVITFNDIDVRNTHEYYDISSLVAGQSFMLRFVSVQPAWDWWWAVDNVKVTGWGGETAFTENFDAFTAGQQVACQDSTNWTTWSQDPCNATEDAYVSDAYAFSGANSAVIVTNNDLVKPLGGQTTGTWYISMMVYIPTGKAGYFNTLGEFFGTPQAWAMEVYFDAGGAGRLLNGGTVNFTWAENTWQQVLLVVDLDADQAELFFGTTDPLLSVASWQWSQGGTIPLKIDANDFFGATPNDEMYFDNYYFGQTMPPIIPVELTSFSAKANNGNVVLNWATATETNNKGFEVQRSAGNEFVTIGFVNGNGTSTQTHEYSFVDNMVATGQYSYRLRQVDFDGTSAYSKVVEISVVAPMVYSLEQNYPNPFNPTTQINFSLASDSKVTLKIFDILGQEVATLLNGNLLAGPHMINFNATSLTSGVYLYRIDATGADGSNFTAVKKMLLTK